MLRSYLLSLYTTKQELVIDSVYIYANNGVAYNAVINIDTNTLKKAHRLGLITKSQYESKVSTIYAKSEVVNADLSQCLDEKQRKGRIIIVYTPRDGKGLVYGGEQSEEEQEKTIIERMKAKRWKCHRRW